MASRPTRESSATTPLRSLEHGARDLSGRRLPASCVVWFLVQRNAAVGSLLGIGSIISLGYIGWFVVAKCTKVERDRMLLALVLIFGAVVFFTLFEQAGSSLNLFADRNVQLPTEGFWNITAAQTQSFNAGFILIGAPLFAALWAWLGQRRAGARSAAQVRLGPDAGGLRLPRARVGRGLRRRRVPPAADLPRRSPISCTPSGELCLSPVGLSEITKLSVPALVSTMMAIWFLSSSWAQYLGGFIAQMAGTETVGGQVLDPAAALRTSLGVFEIIGWVGIGERARLPRAQSGAAALGARRGRHRARARRRS